MTAVALVVLTVLAVACLAAWHPAVVARLDDHPWWAVAVIPAAALGVAAILAAAAPGDGGGPAELAAVLAVAVAVAGGRPVTTAMLRGASQSGIPDITHPTQPAVPADPSATPAPMSADPAAAAAAEPAAPTMPIQRPNPPDQPHLMDRPYPPDQPNQPNQPHQPNPTGSPARPDRPAGPERQLGRPARPVLRGGVWIGALERGAIASCLLAGFGEGIVVVIAVKSLGRYPELRAPGAAERFIIGTFASLLWAGAAAGVAMLI